MLNGQKTVIIENSVEKTKYYLAGFKSQTVFHLL